jgi:hypothetical protein
MAESYHNPGEINNKGLRFFLPAFAFLVIGLTAVVLRAFAAGEFLWLDELHTAWVACSDWSLISSRAADGNQTPLYFFLASAAVKVFGANPLALRAVSLFCGFLLLITATKWTFDLTGRIVAALMVAALLATDLQFVFYASEARPYVLVQLLGLWQAMVFWSMFGSSSNLIEESTSRVSLIKFVGFVLLSVALFYTHFTSIWILFAEAIFLVLISWRSKNASHPESRNSIWWFVLAGVITAGLCVPAIWNFLNVFSRRSNWSEISSLDRVVGELYPWIVFWMVAPCLAHWLATVLVRALTSANEKEKVSDAHLTPSDASKETLLIFLAIWALLGPLAIIAIHCCQIAPMALLRYSAVSWVAFAIFAGVRISSLSVSWSTTIATLIVLASCWQNLLLADCWREQDWVAFRNENWHDPICEIANDTNRSPIFQFGDVIEDIDAFAIPDPRFQTYLAFPLLGIDQVATGGTVNRDFEVIPMSTFGERWQQAHVKKILEHESAWVLVRGDAPLAVEISDHLLEMFVVLESRVSKRMEIEAGQFVGPPGNPIRLLKVTVVDQEEGG